MLLNYPLIAMNTRILCEKEWHAVRRKQSLMGTIRSLRLIYETEGLPGLFRGCHVFSLHELARNSMRYLVDRWLIPRIRRDTIDEAEQSLVANRWRHNARLLAKYAIEMMCYPILMASSRLIIFRGAPEGSWPRVRHWCREEGVGAFFFGIWPHMIGQVFEEAMSLVVDYAVGSTGMEASDQMLLKVTSMAWGSVLLTPIQNVSVIQRCQSHLPGLAEPCPVTDILKNLPLKSACIQFIMFGGILALNFKIIQWKVEVQRNEEEE